MEINIFHFDKQQRKHVPEMFGRTEEEANEDVQMMKEWIKTQTHLPEIMDEVKIKNFLILNKFSIEKTKQKIDMYYTIRGIFPEVYKESNPKLPVMKDYMEAQYFCVHPKPIDGLYRVHFFKIKEPNLFSFLRLLMLGINVIEVRLSDDCVVGEAAFIDAGNLSLSDIKTITPSLLFKYFKIYQEVYSMRIKAVHIFNSHPHVHTLVSTLKPLLKQKIFQRFHIHKDDNILREVFAEDDLPKDYGGKGPSLQELYELLKKKFVQHQARFDKLDTLRVDESKRPSPLDNDDILGFYGNFKKLNVD